MLLREAKEILKKNGYRIIEAFADDAEKFKNARKKWHRIDDIRNKYIGETNLKVVLNDYITLEVEYHTVGIYHGKGRGHLGNNALFEYEFDTPEELLELLPQIEKRAIKASMHYIDIEDDDVDVDTAIAEIKENISKLKAKFQSVVKARKRSDRLDTIYHKIDQDDEDARRNAEASWDAENPLKVGSSITVEMASGKEYEGKITGETIDNATGEEYWVITRSDNGKKVKLNKDDHKRKEYIHKDTSSYDDAMYD